MFFTEQEISQLIAESRDDTTLCYKISKKLKWLIFVCHLLLSSYFKEKCVLTLADVSYIILPIWFMCKCLCMYADLFREEVSIPKHTWV